MKLAIMGAGRWQLPICLKAKEMGIETYAFAYEKGAVAQDEVDHFYPISLVEKEEIARRCEEIGIDGVTTCASDFAIEISCWVAEQLGLNTTSYETVVNIHDKAWVRERTKNLTSISQPAVCTGSLDSIQLPAFPCIVKPVHGYGKRGVWFINNRTDFEHIKNSVEYNVGENALAEQFISGKEYSVESLSFHGNHYVVQITEKYSGGAPHFVELGHHQPANVSKAQREMMTNAVVDILDAVNFTDGASHIELKIAEGNGGIYLIDLNPRGGGDYISTHLISLSTNCDYCKEIINISLDSFDPSGYPYKNIAYSGVYFLTKQTAHLLPYFKQDNPCVVEKEYTDGELTESNNNNDRNGYLIYQSSNKIIL